MVRWRTAAILWFVAGLSSAFLVPYMTDQLLLAVFAIGAAVGIVLAIASLLRRSGRLARWGATAGAVWLVVFVAITLANPEIPSSTSSRSSGSPCSARRQAGCRTDSPEACAPDEGVTSGSVLDDEAGLVGQGRGERGVGRAQHAEPIGGGRAR